MTAIKEEDIRKAEIDYQKLSEELKHERTKCDLNRSMAANLKAKNTEMQIQIFEMKNRIKHYTEILKEKQETYETVQNECVMSELILEKLQKEIKQYSNTENNKENNYVTKPLPDITKLKKDCENLEKDVAESFKKLNGLFEKLNSFYAVQ